MLSTVSLQRGGHCTTASCSIASLSVAVLVLSLCAVVIVFVMRRRQEGFDQMFSPAPVPVTVPMPITASGATLAPLPGPAPNTVYVFWTGGFDSTFRVLQAVIDEGKIVQPFYLSGNIDNAPNRRVKRRNQQMEVQAMQQVRTELCQRYPDACTRLRPPIVVQDVPIDRRTKRWMRALAAQRVVRRPTCQYGSLGAFARYIGVPVELGIVQDGHSNAGIYGGLRDKVQGKGSQCRVTDMAVRTYPEFALFQPLRFPLMYVDKPAMWGIAKQNGYDHLLRRTWSCWYPTAAGKPCNKCLMCRERIVKNA